MDLDQPKTRAKVPIRVWLVWLILLAALALSGYAWWRFFSLQRSHSGPAKLLVSQEEPGQLQLLADKKIWVIGKYPLPPTDNSTDDCSPTEFEISEDDRYHSRRFSTKTLMEPMVVDGQKYQERATIEILGNDHGQRYCLQVANLWGVRQALVSDPVSTPVWLIDSYLTDTDLVVILAKSSETRSLGYSARHYEPYARTGYEDCLTSAELNDIDGRWTDIPLERINLTFSQQADGIRAELSIPRELIGSWRCYHLALGVSVDDSHNKVTNLH